MQFDFHLFLSIRPGIILWPILNLLLLLTILQYNRQISVRFALSILLQTIYIINVFINETSMIRQSLDISPPSSFDALFTNLCWVPFIATLTSVGTIFYRIFEKNVSVIQVLHWKKSSTDFYIHSSCCCYIIYLWIFITTSCYASAGVSKLENVFYLHHLILVHFKQ
jgi:hypothetical protein